MCTYVCYACYPPSHVQPHRDHQPDPTHFAFEPLLPVPDPRPHEPSPETTPFQGSARIPVHLYYPQNDPHFGGLIMAYICTSTEYTDTLG